MKKRPLHLIPLCLIFIPACEEKKTAEEEPPFISNVTKSITNTDIPILPVTKGDKWVYSIQTEIPAGVTSANSAAVDVETRMDREYIGKIRIPGKEPEVDAFEVKSPGQPVQRELVEIYDNRVMMRGSMLPDDPEGKVSWLEPAVVFVFAGMRPGQESANISIFEGTRNRAIQVVARESVTVPAGEFDTIRLLMTGNDDEVTIRKTTWFAPKVGIVKEETVRYVDDNLIYRSTTELLEKTSKSE